MTDEEKKICSRCNVICSEEDLEKGKCAVLGDKPYCKKCLGHIETSLKNRDVN